MDYYDENSPRNRMVRGFWNVMHILHRVSDGKSSQKRILTILAKKGTITQSVLTDHLGIRPASASEVLSKLENAGLITRTVSDKDRRTVNIALTESGAEAAKQALEERSGGEAEMLSVLSEEEQTQLLVLLDKIVDGWREKHPDFGRKNKMSEEQ